MAGTATTIQAGYYRDADSWVYLTAEGDLYLVEAPGEPEPAWRIVGPPLSDDAERKTPPSEELDAFERARVAYGIAE